MSPSTNTQIERLTGKISELASDRSEKAPSTTGTSSPLSVMSFASSIGKRYLLTGLMLSSLGCVGVGKRTPEIKPVYERRLDPATQDTLVELSDFPSLIVDLTKGDLTDRRIGVPTEEDRLKGFKIHGDEYQLVLDSVEEVNQDPSTKRCVATLLPVITPEEFELAAYYGTGPSLVRDHTVEFSVDLIRFGNGWGVQRAGVSCPLGSGFEREFERPGSDHFTALAKDAVFNCIEDNRSD